jgi:putative toxin-antitoxin system antitoxin component (TIGR02293 family)
LVARAVEVLGSRRRALAWLRTPLTGLDGRTPLAAMAEAEGRQQVEDILGRIEHGVFG